jgi:hypothetical protein
VTTVLASVAAAVVLALLLFVAALAGAVHDSRIRRVNTRLARARARNQELVRQRREANRAIDRLALVLILHGVDAREVELVVNEDWLLAHTAGGVR